MKRQAQTTLNFVKGYYDPEESLEVSGTSYDDSHHQSVFKKAKINGEKPCLSSILKNRMVNVSSDTMPRKRKAPISSVRFQHSENMDHINTIDHNDSITIMELRAVIHDLKKKDASNRLQISRLNKQLQLLAEQYSQIETKFKEKQEKVSKSNQYILKLDKELRFYRDEVGKSDRLKGMYSKMMRVEQENQEMRYVIEEQLKEIQDLRLERGGYQEGVGEMNMHLQTYPSSDSERNYPLEITMNPNAHYNYSSEIFDVEYKGNHLSTVMEDSYGNEDYTGGRVNPNGSYHNFSDYYRSKLQDN